MLDETSLDKVVQVLHCNLKTFYRKKDVPTQNQYKQLLRQTFRYFYL